jgi:hypothetical protein
MSRRAVSAEHLAILAYLEDISSHSTQICGEYVFDSPQGQAHATGNQGLAQRDFASMNFLKHQVNRPILPAKISLSEIK